MLSVIEVGGSAALAIAVSAVGPLVAALGDSGFDVPTPQAAMVAAGAVCFAAAQMAGAGPRTAACGAGHADSVQDRDHTWGVARLAGRDEQGRRPQSAFASETDLCGQSAA
ncbi:hypothetical protein ADK86_03610 [Streptomyces sp. NRRL F-5755]|nr:hypothetical protein ADK86_03610 [Streptomyces sp. NRRL F-5755]